MHYFSTSTWKLYCFLERGNVSNTIIIIIISSSSSSSNSVYLFISIILYKSGMLDMEYVIKNTYVWSTEHTITRIKWNM